MSLLLSGGVAAQDSGGLHYYFPAEKVVERVVEAEVCVYGGTSAGITAAVAAARAGREVVVLNPGKHVGGLTTGGLGYTDTGDKRGIGGIAKEFYLEVGRRYGQEGVMVMKFEPHVAAAAFETVLGRVGKRVKFYGKEYLSSVEMRGGRVESVTCESGLTVRAKVFVDATYEGDLMAMARVSFTIGREANTVYGETEDGVFVSTNHQFLNAVDPYVVPGDPKSGLLAMIEPGPEPVRGQGDHRVQAYNFRMCFSKDAGNRVPFTVEPPFYKREKYELLARYLATGWSDVFYKFDAIPGNKTDTNNHGAVSTDYIGANYEWPAGSYETRERIFQDHVNWHRGLFYFLTTDAAVPEKIRARMNEYGLAKDEFVETGNWPPQLYIREARRMVSDYVMTEHSCWGKVVTEDGVGLASYGMDSHNARRFVRDGKVLNEGNVQVHGFPAYAVSYRSIVPKKGECENLLVPVCLSSSHIAYGSIRMEPVFMILGESAGIAADLAIEGKMAVQDVPYGKLKERLLKAGQVVEKLPPRERK